MTEMPAPNLITEGGNAPVIYFDDAPVLAAYHNTFAVTLSVILQIPTTDSRVVAKQVVAAYLRTNKIGLISLKSAIEKALLLAEPKPEGNAQ